MSWSRAAEWLGIAAGVGIWAASFIAAGPALSAHPERGAHLEGAPAALDPMFVRDTRAAGVTGVVVDTRGAPVPGAVVYVYPRSQAPDGEQHGYVTDTLGRFSVNGLAPGHYSFVTVHDLATSGESEVPVFDRSTPVELVIDGEPIDA